MLEFINGLSVNRFFLKKDSCGCVESGGLDYFLDRSSGEQVPRQSAETLGRYRAQPRTGPAFYPLIKPCVSLLKFCF